MTSHQSCGRVVIVGGGLAGSLLAQRLLVLHPDLDVMVLEGGLKLGGDHTWSFHDADLGPAVYRGVSLDLSFVKDLQSARWGDHEVRFPTHARRLAGAYNAIRSDDLAQVLGPRLGGRLHLGVRVAVLRGRDVVLDDGVTIAADCVVDARGLADFVGACAWQTFFGLNLRTARPHRLTRPLLMDATVPQSGSYRFLYVLPWGPTSLLVEDTRYATTPQIDEAGARALMPDYLRRLGVAVYDEVSEERGALPICLSSARRPPTGLDTVSIGVGAGLFQPTTGYSLRAAAMTAELFCRRLSTHGFEGMSRYMAEFAAHWWRRGAFYRRLNNMLFMAATPDERWRVMERFYRLDERLIERFYAQELTAFDRLRILSGKPPVPVWAGIKAYLGRSVCA